MALFYDERDDRLHEAQGSQILYWLDDLGALTLSEASPQSHGFLFTGARPIEDYRKLIAPYPHLRDRPEQREPLLLLDTVLAAMAKSKKPVPMPQTWLLPLDAPIPPDIRYPLFVRTAQTSWKKGGDISKVNNESELVAEGEMLRRALGWDALLLARQWLNLAPAGQGIYGTVPREVRVWIVEGKPFAWSFHYLNVLENPQGFPLSQADKEELQQSAQIVADCFSSCLIAADFAQGEEGQWWFIEAGPGSCAGTGHEETFKAVAQKLAGQKSNWTGDKTGGPL